MSTQTADLRARAILRRLGSSPRGVEVGVYRGALSRRLLVRRDLTLTMVDRWGSSDYTDGGMDLFGWHDETEWHNIRESADVVTRFAADRREIVQADSVAAAEAHTDQSLDFVFIDAEHSYAACMRDILAWWRTVRPGGLLCGHDYAHPDFPDWGVKQAVDEFAAARGLTVELDDDYTWFIRLPGPVSPPSSAYDQIVVACVYWRGPDTVYGPEYVNILADMVARNCELPYQFWCFTNDPAGLAEEVIVKPLPDGLKGWWNKLALFRPDTFLPKTRVLYLDLDTVVTAGIEPLINTRGIAHDWMQGGYNSSVMVWDAGEHTEAWEKFDRWVTFGYHGDQDWLTSFGGWDYLPADWIVSYRLHAQTWPPQSSIVCAFHGQPKSHEVATGWVPEMWTMAGLAIPRYTSVLNNDITTIRANVAANLARTDVPPVTAEKPNATTLVIVGGGPSMASHIPDIVLDQARGAHVWALNGAHDYLIERGVVPQAMTMLDSRRACVDAFLSQPHRDTIYLIATQCDPSAFDRLNGYDVFRWTGWYWGVEDDVIVGGGATVGLKSIALGYILGYRHFRLYGYDSSYLDGADHAYPQPMNADDLRVDIVLYGRKYVAARWMAKQVVEFLSMAHVLTRDHGCTIDIIGDGLLPHAADVAGRQAKEAA